VEHHGRGRPWPPPIFAWPTWSKSRGRRAGPRLESLELRARSWPNALGDVQGAVNTLRYYGGLGRQRSKDTLPRCAAISCRTPLRQAGGRGRPDHSLEFSRSSCWPGSGALPWRAANTLVLKNRPSKTPLTALRMAELSVEAGFFSRRPSSTWVNGYGEKPPGAALGRAPPAWPVEGNLCPTPGVLDQGRAGGFAVAVDHV